MRCISVYTGNFEQFSDIYEKVLSIPLGENEETEIDGITVNESGEAPPNYVEKMRMKPEVAVMREKDRNATIVQRGGMFEILLPEEQNMIN